MVGEDAEGQPRTPSSSTEAHPQTSTSRIVTEPTLADTLTQQPEAPIQLFKKWSDLSQREKTRLAEKVSEMVNQLRKDEVWKSVARRFIETSGQKWPPLRKFLKFCQH